MMRDVAGAETSGDDVRLPMAGLMRKGVGALGIGCLGALHFACGPSFQAIYEGDARFEHCYALEERPLATMAKKADCWRDWSEHYTYGQTRDRVQYAIARYVALAQATSAPTDEAMMQAAPGVVPRVTSIEAPAPTSATLPPPKVLAEGGEGSQAWDAGGDRQDDRPSERSRVVAGATLGHQPIREHVPPSTACTTRCLADFRSCGTSCVASTPGVRSLGGVPCHACDDSYRQCMRTCFD